jgi:hypothetical protein
MGDPLAFVVFSWATTRIHFSFSQFIGTISSCIAEDLQRGQWSEWQVGIDDGTASNYA